ncbi:MAG: type I restriction-modification system subunit M N-terminal domain-containing protein [Oscillospiraceae bacterium]|nr:type I restriction-modification system subunit M N-terminal domain-containing protein [Oscillospiraceae bacterium]
MAVIDGFLTRASGYQFYNISKFTFDSLLAAPDNIEVNFRDYLAGFSSNVQDVLAKFDFDNIIRRMVESNTLYLVIKEFNTPKGYLGPDKISAVDCGYIFEDLVRRFSESFGEEVGAHFTSRDIIYLMTDPLLSDADLTNASNITVYDMAMGTSQMLSCICVFPAICRCSENLILRAISPKTRMNTGLLLVCVYLSQTMIFLCLLSLR